MMRQYLGWSLLVLMLLISFSTSAYAELTSKEWNELAKNNYVLGYYPINGDGCDDTAETFYIAKNVNNKRQALALYQIIRFAFNFAEDGNGSFYKKQFSLANTPNNIDIDRWNGIKYIMPYDIQEMYDLNNIIVKTNNPQLDIRSLFQTDLDIEASNQINRLIDMRIRQVQNLDREFSEIQYHQEAKKLLEPLLNRYYVQTKLLPNAIVDCD